jgi:thiol-disulfide isomerase/thioredoxin
MTLFIQPRNFWTPARLAFSVISFALLAALGFSSCTTPAPVSNDNGGSNVNAAKPGTNVTANNPGSAPPAAGPLPAAVMNTELKALDGSTFKLSDYKGKVILVNLWATWCGPCRAEIPDLINVSQEFKSRGLEVIGLTNEDPQIYDKNVKDFVREFKITYKIGWSDQSFALALMQGQVRNTIPQSFIISRDGRVLKRFVGFSRTETPTKVRLALEEALNEKQG